MTQKEYDTQVKTLVGICFIILVLAFSWALSK